MGLLYNAADQVTTHTEHGDHYEIDSKSVEYHVVLITFST